MDMCAYYADLGRYVRCPVCQDHSDLTLDWPAAPEDPIPVNLQLHGKAARGCIIFHSNPMVAWLWFKHHTKQPPITQELLFDDSLGPPARPDDGPGNGPGDMVPA